MAYVGAALARWERNHERRWLDRHGAVGREATPLLAARLATRYRAQLIEGAVTATVVALLLGYAVWDLATARREAGGGGPDPGMDLLYLITLMVAYAMISAGTLAALWYRRRTDHKLGSTLPCRVARSSAVDLRRLLGGWFLAAAAVTYGGGLLVGGLGLATGATSDRAVAAGFLVAVLVFGGFGTAVLVDVVRRPAVAEDEPSLVDDDVLRREDGQRAITPYLALFAFLAGIHSRSGDGLLAAYLGYAVGAGIILTVATVLASHTRTGAAGTPVAVRP
jgi:hypothetical protein